MQIHRVSATVSHEKSITLKQLPFAEGEHVEVIIMPATPAANTENPYPLRGTPIHFEDPTEPVAGAEWEALR